MRTNPLNWLLLAVKRGRAPFFDFPLMSDVTLQFECHRRWNFTLITLSLMGMSGLDGQPRRGYLKCLICVSSEKGRWSPQQLFIIQSAECGGCLQLSTSVYCWRLSHREERRKAECVWTAGSHPELLLTFCTLWGCNTLLLLIHSLYLVWCLI